MMVISLRSCMGPTVTVGGGGEQARTRSRAAAAQRRFSRVKIYTKTGDAGDTGLFGGERVPKDHPRVVAYGQVDELNAALGVAIACDPAAWQRELFERIQRDLFTIGAQLATPDPARLAKALPGPPVGAAQVGVLEQ